MTVGLQVPASIRLIPVLRTNETYLQQFHIGQRSHHFESICAISFARLLSLPFFDSVSDDGNIKYRVSWNGTFNPMQKAPSGPDGVVRCHGFDILLEITRKTGTLQWSQEYTNAIRHWNDYCSANGAHGRDVYVALVCTNIHSSTYQAIISRPNRDFKMIPIEMGTLTSIMTTSRLAMLMPHGEIQRLLVNIHKAACDLRDLRSFRVEAAAIVKEWEKDVLRTERQAFLGIQSYKAMRRRGHGHIGTSDLYKSLLKNPTVNQYFHHLGCKFSDSDPEEFGEILVNHGFASKLASLRHGETLLQPVPIDDYKSRCSRLINAVVGG